MTRMGADYGLDAPAVIRNLLATGALCLAAAVFIIFFFNPLETIVGTIVVNWVFWSGMSLIIAAMLMVWSSKFGKLKVRERIVEALSLKGDEMVLDVGCGRGLLLNAVARRLTSGKAVGLDLWRQQDLSGNVAATTWENARVEGVADRIDIVTGDMRAMPFEDETFDVVVSGLAVHNVPDEAGRAKAISEIARVLKPGGRLALLDFQHTRAYVRTLRSLGWAHIDRSGPVFSMFPPPTILIAHKPDREN